MGERFGLVRYICAFVEYQNTWTLTQISESKSLFQTGIGVVRFTLSLTFSYQKAEGSSDNVRLYTTSRARSSSHKCHEVVTDKHRLQIDFEHPIVE